MSSVGTWFHKNRALALGVMASGSSLGGVIFPIMIKRLVAEVGFAWSMRIAAFMIFVLLTYANLTVKSRFPPHPTPWSLKEFISPLRELPYSIVVVASFLFFFGMFLPFTYIILEAEYNGMSANLAGYLVSILNAGKFLASSPICIKEICNGICFDGSTPGQFPSLVEQSPATSPTASAASTP